MGAQQVVKFVHPLAMFGRQADRFAKAQFPRLDHACICGLAF
jgi:hypothetical protein